MSAYEKALRQWAEEWKPNLSVEVRELIIMANADLYSGPVQDCETWPGFETACRRIRQALEEYLTRTVYFDYESGVWQDTPPDDEENSGYWYEFNPETLKRAIVGKELSHYV